MTLLPVGLALLGCAEDADRARDLLGWLERDRIEVSAELGETLVEVLVEEGDAVVAGQLLARLDGERRRSAVAAASAEVQRAEARVAELARGGRKEAIAQVRASLDEDRVQIAQAEVDVARYSALVAARVAPQVQLDAATVGLETARARRDRDRARLDELLSGATSEELEQARASWLAAQAELAGREVDLARLSLEAPRAGWVDAVVYQPGERVEPGRPVVVLLADGPPRARVEVPQDWRARVRPGTPATVEADGLDAPLPGRVSFVASEASFTPHYALSEHDRHRLSFPAEIELDEQAADLPAGLPVRVRLELGPSGDEPEAR